MGHFAHADAGSLTILFNDDEGLINAGDTFASFPASGWHRAYIV
jgi:isopenicillin N synthase-like dioxygenase